MIALFISESVPYEACWDTFLALCDDEITAVKVAQKYCAIHINREIEHIEEHLILFQNQSNYNAKEDTKRIKEQMEMLEDIETSSTLDQITAAYKIYGVDGFYIKDCQLITDPADYSIEE